MEKSIVRSLPPLVQGKLTGEFEFAVEKIRLTEKTSFKNDISNLLVRVLWWGETEPLFVRPQKIHFISKDNNKVVVNEHTEHSVKYEVHTNLKLFKSYLEKCEVVELVIVNSLQNEVVGSAFLHNLIHLIFYTQLFNSPVINHSGDSIGEISCQFSFKEVNIKNSLEGIEDNAKESPVKKLSASNLKINLNALNLHSSREENDRGSELNKENNSSRVFNKLSIHSKTALDDLNSQRSSNLHYNSPVTENPELIFGSKLPDMSAYSDKKSELIKAYWKNSSCECVESQEGINPNPPLVLERSEKSLLIDSSTNVFKANLPVEEPRSLLLNAKDKKKILNKSKNSHLVNKRQEDSVNKNRTCNTTYSPKIMNQKKITSKVKSYIQNKAQNNKNNSTERAFVGNKNQPSNVACSKVTGNQKRNKIINGVVTPSTNIKSFLKVSKEISKLNKLYLNSPKNSNNDNSDLEKVPVKEVISCDGSRDHDSLEDVNKKGKDNEKNIKVTESCEKLKSSKTSTKEYESEKFDPNKEPSEYHPNLKKVNVENKLRFDLNDPIEKIYYETFFLKTRSVSNNEFEIAELLNQPENKYILEMTQSRTFGENTQQLDKHLLPEKDDVNSQHTRLYTNKTEIRKDDRKSEEILPEPPKLRKDKEDSCMKYELLEPVTGASQDSNSKSKTQREYKIDCHRCKYYKKLSELDKIIESLKIFETRLKNEVVLSSLSLNADGSAKSFTDGRPILPKSNPPVQSVGDSKSSRIRQSDEELSLEPDNYGSDLSKEDSDFIEFTHYLSKR